MRHLRSLIVAMGLTAAVSLQASISITSEDFSYFQDFDSLPMGSEALVWSNNSTIPGWYQGYTGTVAETTEWTFGIEPDGAGLVSAGGVSENNSARFANLGHANSTDRSVGMQRRFSLTGSIGAVFQNDAGMTLPGFALGYTGEQWRRGRSEETPLYFEYQIVSDVNSLNINSAPENWTRVDALQFDSPRFDDGVVDLELDGKWPAHRTVIAPVMVIDPIPEGASLVARWHQDRTNSAGGSTNSWHFLAVDDVSVAVIPEPSHFAWALGAFGLLLMIFRRRRITER